MEPEDILNEYGSEESKRGWLAAREAGWEATAVRRVLTALKLGPVRLVMEAGESLCGDSGLTFAAFNQVFQLPVRFGSARVHGHKLPMEEGDLKGFTRSWLYEAYQQNLDEHPHDERRLALVFPWTGKGTKVLYQGMPSPGVEGESRLVFFKSVTYTIDQLPRYLKVIDRDWIRIHERDPRA